LRVKHVLKQTSVMLTSLSEAKTLCWRAGLLLRCLVPAFGGAYFCREWKETLWDRFYTGAPRRQRQCVERYNIVKRA
jgi:hypothetical protein